MSIPGDVVYKHALSPTQFLPRAAAIEPNATAIYHVNLNGEVERRTYKTFARRAAGLAYFLKDSGYKRVGILVPNTPTFLDSVFGIGGAGAINVAINCRLKEEDIRYIFEHSEVDLIITDVQYEPLLKAFRKAHPSVPIIIDTDTGPENGPFNEAIREGLDLDFRHGDFGWAGLQAQYPNEDDMVALSYTSGTTSRPKGVIYTHRGAYLATLGNLIESELNKSSIRCGYLWILPMFHAMGWTFPWGVTAVRGTHYCLRKIEYSNIWQLLLSEPITHFCAAPTVNTLLCRHKDAKRLPRPVQVVVAASPPSVVLFNQMITLNFLPVHGYGLTESYGPVTKSYIPPEWVGDSDEKYTQLARQGHSMITALPVRVVKSGGNPKLVHVAQNGAEIGEVVITGNLCTKGYYKDPAGTQNLFGGGWMHTGDLAVMHPNGAIQVVDRAKDIIISGGENISSVAVENALMKHPDVIEAAVIGIPHEKWGETPKAFITTVPDSRVEGQDVRKWVRENSEIGGFMVPSQVEVVSELPKNSTGKMQKKVLREMEVKRRQRVANL
ncbi:hypothetical protein N7467_001887 [Penicillium canescens]|nr:hypothetical protein N7467_001887 [Penicillium canescens]